MKTWLLAVTHAMLATGSYVLGASLQTVPGMALWLYLALGILVAAVTLIIEYFTNVRPTRHWREVAPVQDRGAYCPCSWPNIPLMTRDGVKLTDRKRLMKMAKKDLKLKRINGGFYTLEGYTPPSEVTPTRLRRITRLLMRRVKPPVKAF